jgi:hypothetical protein
LHSTLLINSFFYKVSRPVYQETGIFPVISGASPAEKLQIVLAQHYGCAYSVAMWCEVGKNVLKWVKMTSGW